MSQFITEAEMHRIKGLIHYLNESFDNPQVANMAVEVKLIDSNGEALGTIDFENENVERYVFYYGS